MTTSCNDVLAHSISLGHLVCLICRVPGKQGETEKEVKLGGRLYLLAFNECLLFKRGGSSMENGVRKCDKEFSLANKREGILN